MGLGRLALRAVVGLGCAAVLGWMALAINYSPLQPAWLRGGLSALVPVGAVVALLLVRPLWRVLAGILAAFVVVLGAWLSIPPSNERDWQPEVAVLPYAELHGDRITVHNIRNFAYRSETDFTPAYYDKTFDLRKLDRVDLIAVYWMGPAVAHVFLSFGFAGGDHLAVSIETRKEKGEGYSTLKGFFKQYELFYVVADERDVIRVRTNFRNDPPEEVYVYRVHGPIEIGRQLFLDYMRKISALRVRPEFYNTLTTNCTTTIWMHSRVNPRRVPFSWKILLSGYVPEYLYEVGRLDTSLPFADLKARSRINERAKAAGDDPRFSARIREGLPRMILEPDSGGATQ
jgi:hypothetical protein